MAEPISQSLLAVATVGLSVAGGIQQAAALQEQADTTRAFADELAERERREAQRRLGLARANIGASGIALEGAPLEVLSDIAAEGELGARTTEFEGETKARAIDARARSTLTQTFVGAGSSLLDSSSTFKKLFED